MAASGWLLNLGFSGGGTPAPPDSGLIGRIRLGAAEYLGTDPGRREYLGAQVGDYPYMGIRSSQFEQGASQV